MSGKRLYISDMDGTLLGEDSRLSSLSAEILSSLSSRGVLITVATARTPASVEPLLAEFRGTVPAVVMTGAALWDRVNRAYIDPQFVPRHEVGPIIDACRENRITPLVYTLDSDTGILNVYSDGPLERAQQKFIEERADLPLKRFHLDTPLPDSASGKVMLIYAFGPMESIDRLAASLSGGSKCSMSVYADIFDASRGNLEIFAPGVSKAAGIKRLAEIVGATDITVFGDNLNDLPMMAAATRAVAVGNAVDAVKEAADVVIGPNTEDSVPRFIDAENRP